MATTISALQQLDQTKLNPISETMSSSMHSGVSGRAKSCTGCRQVKTKCDARRIQPCTRCRQNGLQCKFDSNFKRIPTRRIAQEITNELHKLRPSAAASTLASSSPGHSDNAHSGQFATSDTPSDQQYETPDQEFPPQWLRIAEADYYVNYGVGTLDLEPETVIVLFQHFERYHLPHSPFLKPIQSLSVFATTSPLLFWTIILVSTREHGDFQGLYEQIVTPHVLLVSQLTNNAIQYIEDVHSLLLLCLWPIPRRRGIHDPSWNYIGLATNAAVQLNCHRPFPKNDIGGGWRGLADSTMNEMGSETASLTWIYCFYIGARIADCFGYPPPMATSMQLRSISSAAAAIPPNLRRGQRVTIEILKLSSLSTVELDFTDDPHTRHSMAQMFDGQFDDIAVSHKDNWSPEIEVQLAAAKLYLYGLTFVVDKDKIKDAQELLINRQLVLRRGLDTSTSLISNMALLSNTVVDQGKHPAGLLSFYPKFFFHQLHFAAVYIFRFLASYRGASQHEKGLAISGLTEAHKIFQSFPDHRDAIKAAVNIELYVDVLRGPPTSHPYPLDELIIQTRLGMSMIYDAQFRIHHHRNKDPTTHVGRAPPDWVPFDQDPRYRLPPTPDLRQAPGSGQPNNPTIDVGQPTQAQMMGPWWTDWDTYMSDFEVGPEAWDLNMRGPHSQTPIDPGIQELRLEAANLSSLPIIGREHNSTHNE